MHALEAAIVDMIVAANREQGDRQAFGRAIAAATAARSSCDASTARAAMARLAAALPELHRTTIPMIAMWCGDLARLGADPEPPTPELIDWLLDLLSYTIVFRQAWKKNVADPEWAGADLPAEPPIAFDDIEDANARQLYEGIAEVLPDEAWSWEELGMLCKGVQALAACSLVVRRRLRETELLVEALHTVAPSQPAAVDLLAILRVADEVPLLVLHPEHRRGYRVVLTGVSQNSQLNTLLTDALVGEPADGWLPGERPAPHLAYLAREGVLRHDSPTIDGVFNFFRWYALGDDGRLNPSWEQHAAWVPLDGTPTEIPRLDGTRIVLLGPFPFRRTWNVGGRFLHMRAEVRVEEKLGPAAIEEWLARIQDSKRDPTKTAPQSEDKIDPVIVDCELPQVKRAK